MNKIWTTLILLFVTTLAMAGEEDGYKIDISLKGFEGEFVLVAYHYGNMQYIKDSVFVNKTGGYTFEGEESLDPGMYMIVMPPENKSIDILINSDNQHFSITSNTVGNMAKETTFVGSEDNTLFYGYLQYLSDQRTTASRLTEEYKAAEANEDKTKVETIKATMQLMNDKVYEYQQDIINRHPASFTATFIRASLEVKIPDSPRDDRGNIIDSSFQYKYYRAHYLDNIDLTDERLVRTPLLHSKMMRYVDKVVPQHFDSISLAIDDILDKSIDEEIHKYLLIQFLNKYAKSKIVGMDAVYVHLVDNYYAVGKAPWTAEEQLKKIMKDAGKLRPLLLEKTAPDFRVKYVSNPTQSINLHGVESEYTILIFWAPDCGHCKKSMPQLAAFYEEYKTKGVKVFSVCSKIGEGTKDCAPFIEEKGMNGFINVFDPDPRHPSRFQVTYDVTYTPIIFILDKDKVIKSKRIGVDKLGEVIDNLKKIEYRKSIKNR